MAIELIAKIAPKNDGFVGMIDADQVLGGGAAGTFPDACVAASNVTQHEGSIDHDALANFEAAEHFTKGSIDLADLGDVPAHPGADKVLETTADGYAWIDTPSGDDGANTALSNLTGTSINQHLFPDGGNARDLGSSVASNQWRNLFVNTIYLNGRISRWDDYLTFIQFEAANQITFWVGPVPIDCLLTLYGGTQDYVKLGDGGDVDINLNDDVFIEGSSGDVSMVADLAVTGDVTGANLNPGNWDDAYSHSEIVGGNSVHVSTAENTQWDAGYSHSQTTHNYAYISGNDGATDITAAELEELSDGSETTLHSHAGDGAKANTALSNLTTTSINQSLIPDENSVRDLGTAAKHWGDIYVDAAHVAGLLVSGTVGREGDPDTLIYFGIADSMGFLIGNEYLLELHEGTQDYVKLGDGGDVDINLNDKMFIEGSSGNVGVNVTSFDALLDGGLQVQPNSRSKFGLIMNDTDGSRVLGYYIDSDGDSAQFLYDRFAVLKVLLLANGDSYFMGGSLGINDSTPTYKLDVNGTGRFTGALTSGGADPPYELFWSETRQSVVDRIKRNIPADLLDGCALFYNEEADQMELYLPAKGEFRDLQNNILDRITPIIETFKVVDKYYLDEDTGEVLCIKVPNSQNKKYRLKSGYRLDGKTGKFYNKADIEIERNNAIEFVVPITKEIVI